MTVIVNSGSVVVVPASGLTLTADSTIAAGGVLDDSSGGTISGGFNLVNDGTIKTSLGVLGVLTIDTGGFDNQGTIEAFSGLTIGPSVNLANLVDGTLTGGSWTIYSDVDFLNGTISSLDAVTAGLDYVTEAGPGGTGTQSIENTLTEIGVGASITFDKPLLSSGGLNVDGDLTLNTILGVTVAAGITISPTGTLAIEFASPIDAPLIVNGVMTLAPTAGIGIQLDGVVSGNGTIFGNGGTVTLSSSGTFAPDATLAGGHVVAEIASSGPGSGPVSETILDPSGFFNAFLIENTSSVPAMNTLELADATTTSVTFDGAPTGADFGTLILDQPAGFGGTLVGVNNHSTIILRGIVGDTATLVTNPLTGTTLSVLNGTTPLFGVSVAPNSYSEQISLGSNRNEFFSQQFGQAIATATADVADNETTITVSGVQDTVFCFRAGARIGTPGGPVAVEDLAPDDLVTTHFGATRRVVWTGHREIDCRRHPDPRSVWPVRISSNAFAEGQPHSPLYLSPGHAVFVDGDLIPVRLLINGTTIRQIAMHRVTYHHIELEEHDILVAEDLLVESFLDCGDRGFFANGGTPIQLFPNFAARSWEMAGCAPLVVTGPRLARARAMLRKRAAVPFLFRNLLQA